MSSYQAGIDLPISPIHMRVVSLSIQHQSHKWLTRFVRNVLSDLISACGVEGLSLAFARLVPSVAVIHSLVVMMP